MIIIFIYKEDFFYDYILQDSLEEIKKVIENKENNYYIIKIPKKDGLRKLNCIKKETKLYQYQTLIKNKFLNRIPIAENVYGFVKGQSYKDFLVPHTWENNKKRFYLRIDIKDFFGSINTDTLRQVFRYYFKTDENASNEMIDLLLDIVSLDGFLPQGAVTSPVISNIVFRQLDLRIQKYCNKLNFTYTRYADDLLFSSINKRIYDPFFIKMISTILKSRNFKINHSKVKTSDEEISLNGFVVGKNIRLSRSKKRDLNRILFIFQDQKPKNITDFLSLLNSKKFKSRINVNNEYFSNKTNLLNYLSGYRSFLISWLPENKSSPDFKSSKIYIKRIEELILNINNMN
ncbi:reverse transcriptase family protein [Ectobacillus panaciterrae]|uniref:reverse transcriptase family protein n=1 Tax=Ectobacillus panaciterrae TaxID=363872 RepID=UPI0004034BAB|nr:reverse transcriptase family protein [Ectobacillus panaciterrae]